MKRFLTLLLLCLICVVLAGCGTVYINPYENIPKPEATITMDDGTQMVFILDPASAPNTVSNFITLANSGYYDGLKLDYVYPTWYIRGGDPDGNGTGGPDYTIEGEFAANGFQLNKLKHVKGVISMCRLIDDYNSAGSQFFIMLGSHSEYNDNYAAFGWIDENDTASLNALQSLSNVMLDNSYRPLLKQKIKSIRVDTKGYIYIVVKYGEVVENEETKE